MSDIPDLARVLAEIEDHLIPLLRLGAFERALYYHLLRHSRVVGSPTVRIGMDTLARDSGLSAPTVRNRLHRLQQKGCLRITGRDRQGTTLEVFLPEEILPRLWQNSTPPADAYSNPRLRAQILDRDGGRCFYCLRELTLESATLDHIVPQAAGGESTSTNLVACCHECNSAKGATPAGDFLRALYRGGRLTSAELEERLSACAYSSSSMFGPFTRTL